jgi:hypothetical protein
MHGIDVVILLNLQVQNTASSSAWQPLTVLLPDKL